MLNRIHPTVNFIYFAFVLIITMFTLNPEYCLASFLISIIYLIYLKGLKGISFELKLSFWIFLITSIGNFLLVHDGEIILFYLNNNRVTLEALVRGMMIGLVIVSVIFWFAIIQELFDSERFMVIFARFAPKFSLLVSMILRYIPELKKRYSQIHEANRCLVKKDQSSWLDRVEKSAEEYSTLVSWSLEDAIETGDSMESRGYGTARRTSIRKIYFNGISLGLLLADTVCFGLAIYGVSNYDFKFYYYPTFIIPGISVIRLLCFIAYICLLLIPLFVKVIGDIRWKSLMSKI